MSRAGSSSSSVAAPLWAVDLRGGLWNAGPVELLVSVSRGRCATFSMPQCQRVCLGMSAAARGRGRRPRGVVALVAAARPSPGTAPVGPPGSGSHEVLAIQRDRRALPSQASCARSQPPPPRIQPVGVQRDQDPPQRARAVRHETRGMRSDASGHPAPAAAAGAGRRRPAPASGSWTPARRR